MEGAICSLRAAAGAGEELCPGSRCAFWDGGCIADARRIPLDDPLVARYLLELRLALEQDRAEEETQSPRLLAERLSLDRE